MYPSIRSKKPPTSKRHIRAQVQIKKATAAAAAPATPPTAKEAPAPVNGGTTGTVVLDLVTTGVNGTDVVSGSGVNVVFFGTWDEEIVTGMVVTVVDVVVLCGGCGGCGSLVCGGCDGLVCDALVRDDLVVSVIVSVSHGVVSVVCSVVVDTVVVSEILVVGTTVFVFSVAVVDGTTEVEVLPVHGFPAWT